ncbi:hypothetical protein [Flavisolibacter tropicus]|uniref:Uncharacterized protein n=1 Tax=Flavisolibacter tropicus TaxID=1492898 RepID=A0A172TTD1_9BACT|nr:hypothetical protein [Flavisolibacter tropicus]ANE50361.1 hypothetical protein SY85_07485 [Flavisolibacter tropicus]
MKKELTDIERLSPLLIGILLMVILCFIWKPAVNKQHNVVKPSSAIEVDLWNVWQVGVYVIN